MADLPPTPSDASAGAAPAGAASAGRDAHPGMPRWVKAAIAVVLVLVVVLVIGKLAGVEHGPGMHGGSGQTPASQVSEDGATPPGAEGHTPPAGAEGHTPPAGAEGHTPPPGIDHGQP